MVVFFPRGVTLSDDPSAWRCFLEVRDSLLVALTRPLSLRHLLHHGRRISKRLANRRPGRPGQVSRFIASVG